MVYQTNNLVYNIVKNKILKRGDKMSGAKLEAIKMIEALPESKAVFVLKILKDIQELIEENDDEVLLEQAKKIKTEDQFISFEQTLEELGLDINDIQY